MTINLKLVDSDSQIEKKINEAIAKELNKLVNKSSKRVSERIKMALEGWITSQPEIASLQSEGVAGELNAQFGLTMGQGAIASAEIIQAVLSTLEVKIRPIDSRLRGGVDFNIQPSNFRTLLDLPSGFVVTDSSPLHWLNWLLMEGTKTIVYGYSYTPDFSGRSGGGTMKKGGVWRIPPQYSGSQQDNFITRALKGRDKELSSILQDVFK
jgi:hypothetical protein